MYRLIKFLTLVLLFSSCKGGLISPKLKLTLLSATVQADGSVLLEGNIDSEGEDAINELGFCVGDSLPTALNNLPTTKTVSANGKKFTITYEKTLFRYEPVYHFRAWARANSTYTYSNDLSLTKIVAAPVTPSCTWAANTCSIGGGQPNNSMNQGTGTGGFGTRITVSGGTIAQMTLDFGGSAQLTTGIYKTSVGGSSEGTVQVSFYSGMLYESLKAGSNVYVNLLSSGFYEITICNAPWTANGGSMLIYLNGRFKARVQ